MATSTRFDLAGHQGSEFYTQFNIKNKDSLGNITAFDLSNKVIVGQIRSDYSSTEFYNFDITIADESSGAIVVYMGADETALMPVGPLVYDIEIRDLTDTRNVIKPLWGNFFLRPEVTR